MITTRAPDGANKLRIVRLKAFHYHSPPSVHLSLASQGWLRRFLSVSSSPSSTLPKPPTAKETNAQVIFYPEFNHRPRPWFIKLSSNYFTQYINIYGYYLCLYLTQLSKAGLIITGGWDTETSIETFGAELNCSIPPFPSPGNQSCSL